VITGSEPEVGVLPLVLIDLDELLPAVAELEIVEGHVVAATRHVNRVVPDPLQRQVGDGDVVDIDVNELGGAGAVAGVEDDGVAIAGGGSQGYVRVAEPQEGGDGIVAVGEEDGGVGGGGADDRRKICGTLGCHADNDVAVRRWSQRWTVGIGTPSLAGHERKKNSDGGDKHPGDAAQSGAPGGLHMTASLDETGCGRYGSDHRTRGGGAGRPHGASPSARQPS
jgi:hypothetical protein